MKHFLNVNLTMRDTIIIRLILITFTDKRRQKPKFLKIKFLLETIARSHLSHTKEEINLFAKKQSKKRKYQRFQKKRFNCKRVKRKLR